MISVAGQFGKIVVAQLSWMLFLTVIVLPTGFVGKFNFPQESRALESPFTRAVKQIQVFRGPVHR